MLSNINNKMAYFYTARNVLLFLVLEGYGYTLLL